MHAAVIISNFWSMRNPNSHFLELLPDMNSRKQKSSTHSLFECKLVVKENAHLKRKRKDVLLTQTFELQTKILHMIIRLRKKHVLHSFIYVSAELFTTQNVEKDVWVRRVQLEIRLKLTNRTHTDERKIVQLSYFVPGCVISMLILIVFINWCTLEWSGEY